MNYFIEDRVRFILYSCHFNTAEKHFECHISNGIFFKKLDRLVGNTSNTKYS